MAKDKAPKIKKIKEKDISEGVYLTEGADPYLGPGWYHINTPEDQIFRGHPGERDFIVPADEVFQRPDGSFIWRGPVNEQSNPIKGIGNDQFTHWDKGFDGWGGWPAYRGTTITDIDMDGILESTGIVVDNSHTNTWGLRLVSTGDSNSFIDEKIGTLTFWAYDTIA
jgi:hypothetical protein